MSDAILVLNVGSSSIKFSVNELETLTVIWRGGIENIEGSARFILSETSSDISDPLPSPPFKFDHASLIDWLLKEINAGLPDISITAVGHRVVHGGVEYVQPVIVTDDIVTALQSLSFLAPNHQPYSLMAIKAISQRWNHVAQVACFDTSFHRTQPRIAQLFALPRNLTDNGVIRYGFHGLSYEYIAQKLPEVVGEKAKGRVIVAHLGHGASMCAMAGGRSVATTMGFSVLDGLMMGTRCGALDPGVVLYLIDQKGMSAKDVRALLSNESGLLGVSGLSDDVRPLLASNDSHAVEALDLFVYRATKEIGSLVAILGGLDALVFTAGIGEHAPELRRRICEGAQWTGLQLDKTANDNNAVRISAKSSVIDALVIRTNEEIIIARATKDALID